VIFSSDRLAVATTLACVVAFTAPARAEDFVVDKGNTSATLSGIRLYGKVTIDGTLTVNGYEPTDPDSGYLWIRAREITVGATGVIDASGKGYRGLKTGGEGFNSVSAGGTPFANMMSSNTPAPGGGGAHLGKGGDGLDAGCKLVMNANGGAVYDNAMMSLALALPQQGMGSAGGASHAGDPNPNEVVAGGDGGGVVILEAATITLDGAVLADGTGPKSTFFSSSAGGGAGGTIYLWANKLAAGMNAKLSARGGKGVAGNRVGGSGGGGLVVLEVKTAPQTMPSITVLGGDTSMMSCPGAKGGDGKVHQKMNASCVDADRDSHASEPCGKDCNDVDSKVKPEQVESCNGIDDDCNGKVDDGDAAKSCKKGQTCEMGVCKDVMVDNTGGAAPTEDPRIRLHGGACSARIGSSGGWSALLAAGALVAIGRLRRRRKS
jgi:hypothetical protein